MENRFKPMMNVLIRSSKNKNKFIKASVTCEKYNGGHGGFYSIRYVSNGHERTVSGNKLIPYVLIEQINHAGLVV